MKAVRPVIDSNGVSSPNEVDKIAQPVGREKEGKKEGKDGLVLKYTMHYLYMKGRFRAIKGWGNQN